MHMGIRNEAVAFVAVLALCSGAAFSAPKAKFKPAPPVGGNSGIDQEYVDQFPWSFCARGEIASDMPVSKPPDTKISIKSVDCEYVSAPTVGLLPLNQFQTLIDHGAQDDPRFKQVAWRHGLSGWRLPTEAELFYATKQGYLRPGFWYAAKAEDGSITQWKMKNSTVLTALDQLMPLYVRSGVGSDSNPGALEKQLGPSSPTCEKASYLRTSFPPISVARLTDLEIIPKDPGRGNGTVSQLAIDIVINPGIYAGDFSMYLWGRMPNGLIDYHKVQFPMAPNETKLYKILWSTMVTPFLEADAFGYIFIPNGPANDGDFSKLIRVDCIGFEFRK